MNKANSLCSRRTKTLTTLAALLFCGLAQGGPVYTYSESNPDGNDAAGTLLEYGLRYDWGSELLSWDTLFDETPTGFWLVLSHGDNPKGDPDEAAILYGDAYTGNVTAYIYNGRNDSSSWRTDPFITSYAGVLTGSLSFSLDVTVINTFITSPQWTGTSFADYVGIWYHPFVHEADQIRYADDGRLSAFGYSVSGWYDRSWGRTAQVPEPATIALLGLGLALMTLLRRRPSKALRSTRGGRQARS